MKYLYFFLLAAAIFFAGCAINDNDEQNASIMELDIPEDFNFSTQNDVCLQIALRDMEGSAIPGVVYKLYYLNHENEPRYIRSNMTNTMGTLNTTLSLPSYVEKVMISGFMNTAELDIVDCKAEYNFFMDEQDRTYDGTFFAPERNRNFSYLPGITYNSQGVPFPHDIFTITSEMMLMVDTSLPEQISLLQSHPQYLQDGITTNFIITDSSDVWLTFVTEGAGYKNSLGFYTYDNDEGAPQDPASLDHVLVFPNVSLNGSGGNLPPGTKIYLGRFGAGTIMGWFLVQNGWQSGANVSSLAQILYSNREFNPQSPQYNQQSILLYDAASEIFLVAFEDIVRPAGDNDFNDAVFFVTANPIENIDVSSIQPVDIPIDTDGDGVNDPFDEFPDDPLRAFKVHYPALDQKATLVFEDKWPLYGDYDMNDLVLDYNYMITTNALDEVKDLYMSFSLAAAGAFYNNGFSIILPFDFDNLNLAEHSSNISPNLVQDGDYTIIDLFNAANQISGLPAGTFMNTEPDEPFYLPVDFEAIVTLSLPVPLEDLDFSFPFNPFLRRQGNSSHEIHLMDFFPSTRHNVSLFQTDDDDSNPATGNFYSSILNLPWALNLTENWKYPRERKSITTAYTWFASWAESGGTIHQDWYIYEQDRINPENIYDQP
jgi:LruC domain-containing protein